MRFFLLLLLIGCEPDHVILIDATTPDSAAPVDASTADAWSGSKIVLTFGPADDPVNCPDFAMIPYIEPYTGPWLNSGCTLTATRDHARFDCPASFVPPVGEVLECFIGDSAGTCTDTRTRVCHYAVTVQITNYP